MYIIQKAAAPMYGWDCPILTLIYTGFDCCSPGCGSKIGTQNGSLAKKPLGVLVELSIPSLHHRFRQQLRSTGEQNQPPLRPQHAARLAKKPSRGGQIESGGPCLSSFCQRSKILRPDSIHPKQKPCQLPNQIPGFWNTHTQSED